MYRPTLRTLAGTGVIVALIAASMTGLASAGTPRGSDPSPAFAKRTSATTLREITLITSDRVTVSGTGAVLRVQPGPGRDGQLITRFTENGNEYVVPKDAERAIAAGRLDRRLFDISALLAAGLDDRRSPSLPLLVTSASGPRAAAVAPAALPGTTVTRPMPSLGATAMTSAKKDTGQLWRAVSGARAAVPGKVWLNGRAKLSLDQSAGQIGAPAAWKAGFTGKGVTVAVLDTGYDAKHADLTGVVTGSKDFTNSPDGVKDTEGHGTHVASTVAGRGTASGGKYVGVAREASLLIGKVCSSDGCSFDAILAGMEWAARSGAKVVNLSLGDNDSDGTDPISKAVNALTAQYGTLFVAAAGNSGTATKPGSPAAADAALAVGSVSRQDAPSDFSTRGPRVGDYAVKPDIAAPGEGIVAARAAGTLDDYAVDERHARLSGTSMATPHVAGAATILYQQHPDWSPAQIKAHLMSTSKAIAKAGPYEAGSGRTDLTRAVSQRVTADQGSLSMGNHLWPHQSSQRVTKSVTYRNTGSAAVTLALSAAATDEKGAPAPNGVWTLDASTLTVPAGGTAQAAVTLDPTKGVGQFGGWVTATNADTSVVVRTAIGGRSEPERFAVTVRIIGRDGKPAARQGVGISPLGNDPDRYWGTTDAAGTATVRVPRGDYGVSSSVTLFPPGTPDYDHPTSVTDLVVPKLTVKAGVSVALDARKARPLTVSIADDRSVQVGSRMSQLSFRAGGGRDDSLTSYFGDESTAWYSWSAGSANPNLRYVTGATLERPVITLDVRTPQRFPVPVRYEAGSNGLLLGDRTFTLVDVNLGRPEDIAGKNLRGALVLLRDTGEQYIADIVKRLAAAGAAAVLKVGPTNWLEDERYALPIIRTTTTAAARLLAPAAAARVTVATHGITASPVAYNLVFPEYRAVPTGKRYQVRRSQLGRVDTEYRSQGTDAKGRVDNLPMLGDEILATGYPQRLLRTPIRRVEYFSAGPVRWHRSHTVGDYLRHGNVTPLADTWAETDPVQFRAGDRRSRVWGATPFGPSLHGQGLQGVSPEGIVQRDRDKIQAEIPAFSAGTPAGMPPVVAPGGNFLAGSLTLRRNGTVLGTTNNPVVGEWEVPAGAGRYELALTATRSAPQFKLANTVHTTWGFDSTAVSGDKPTKLPLLTVDCVLPTLDARNSASAKATTPMSITIARQAGAGTARVTKVKVWASTDGGAHWTEVRAEQHGKQWQASMPGGAPGQRVSLRVSATDSTGSTVDQRMIGAYALR